MTVQAPAKDAIAVEINLAAIGGVQPLKPLLRAAKRAIESKVILLALEANGWNRKKAAKALAISYRALLYKMEDPAFELLRPARGT
jgi:two-component system response regulator AtoC